MHVIGVSGSQRDRAPWPVTTTAMASKESYKLIKFSNATLKNAPGAQNSQDWHHFTQPVMRLLLERDERSARLRVVWTRESNPTSKLKTANDIMTLVSLLAELFI